MSMFNKADSDQASQSGQVESFRGNVRTSGAPSIISADLKVVGDLTCSGDIQIDGTIEGDVKSKTVTVGEGAQINGSISAETVNIRGSVSGETRATTVLVSKSARVEGDIIHEQLSIESGAYLDGYCRRMDMNKKASTGTTEKVATITPRPDSTPKAAAADGAVAGSKPLAS